MHSDSDTDFAAPYFPRALALSWDCPLDFNFDLRLLDSLCLPCEIEPREQMQLVMSTCGPQPTMEPVRFENSADAIAHCQEKIMGWLPRETSGSSSQRRLSHPKLDKVRLFEQEGRALQHLLGSGIAHLDSNLTKVRLDR